VSLREISFKELKIKILTPGLLATVQDLGRPQWRSSGVPLGGAADAQSHRLANILLSNDEGAATIEIAGGGFVAQVEEAGWVAVCGAGGRFFLEKKEVSEGRLTLAPEGALLEIRASEKGNYAYLAARGGWDVPQVLGSRSTCLSASFGGLEGRALQKEDVLQTLDSSDDSNPSHEFRSEWFVKIPIFGSADPRVIRALPGPEIHWWSAAQQKDFFAVPFFISKQRDRMGVRLETSSPLPPPKGEKAEMLSTAVSPGTVQVPPDGQPIILLADAQTTGGYPRIAQVIAVDIPRLAQMPAGQTFYFQKVTLDEAERLFFERERFFKKLQLAMRLVAC
jgi:antagonist of KipI